MDRHRRSENIDYAAIGQRLRAARNRCGLSVLEASKKTGIGPGAISALELNRRNPGLVALFTFCRTYGCSLDEIVFGAAPSVPASPVPSSSPDEPVAEDPYYRSLKELTEQMDDAEKDFMLRLVGTAHQEFGFVRNKMK